MRPRVTIGSRGSMLALTQTEHVADLLRSAALGLVVKIDVITTTGDRVLDKPLAAIGGKGLFTEELEAALRDGSIDLAVHSLKDLPTETPDALCVGAVPKRATPNDALVCAKWARLEDLPDGARVGTSSLRRKAQLLALKPGLDVVDIRGNIDTRIAKVLDRQEMDAAILACAGLERIGRMDVVAEILSPEVMLPAPGQGALGIQARADDEELLDLLFQINDPCAAAETAAERAMLAALGGGCQVPIGALARTEGDALSLSGCVCSLDGTQVLRAEVSGPASDAEALGNRAAEKLLASGANAIVAELI